MSENNTWDYIAERAKREAEHIIFTGATVRACANYFGISKSTVHKDVSERLKDVDAGMYAAVRRVLDKNLSERHIRGGMATRDKYLRNSTRQNGNEGCGGRCEKGGMCSACTSLHGCACTHPAEKS